MSSRSETLDPPIVEQPPIPSAWPPEQAVLGYLLDAHPRRLDTVALAADLRARLQPAEVERALVNLTEAGLLESAEGALVPTPAVLRFEALLG